VRMVLPGDPGGIIGAELARMPGVRAVEAVSDAEGEGFWLYPDSERPIVRQVAELARTRGWPMNGLRVERGRLDDLFRSITLSELALAKPDDPEHAAAA
jgi:ABC-2 type transport system ATP-binding protein